MTATKPRTESRAFVANEIGRQECPVDAEAPSCGASSSLSDLAAPSGAALLGGVCAHPGCGRGIRPDSRTGVCRDHMHQMGCRCRQCTEGRAAGERVRVRSRAEMVALGLLPARPLWR